MSQIKVDLVLRERVCPQISQIKADLFLGEILTTKSTEFFTENSEDFFKLKVR